MKKGIYKYSIYKYNIYKYAHITNPCIIGCEPSMNASMNATLNLLGVDSRGYCCGISVRAYDRNMRGPAFIFGFSCAVWTVVVNCVRDIVDSKSHIFGDFVVKHVSNNLKQKYPH